MRNHRGRSLVVTAAAVLATAFSAIGAARQAPAPKLLVFVVVDQMRADYLSRFGHMFRGGLDRLMRHGAVFSEAHHHHGFTATAPGHASLVTGVHPARHGIVGNDWWDRTEGRRVYAAEDVAAGILGYPDSPGRSPVNLLRPGLADWLKAQSPDSKVFAVAIKDRVAALMGGRTPDGVYWYQYDTGRFVTSSFYRQDYPAWVTVFNDSGPVHELVTRTWERLLPEDAYAESREDAFPAEADSVHSTFPHPIARVVPTDSGPEAPVIDSNAFSELANTPFGDELTLAFAREVILRENLGVDDHPDLLLVGASSADLIGHRYGPYSQEVEDYYLRLDLLLGDLFEFLDQELGQESYAVVLSSDHGVAMMPEEAARRGVGAKRISAGDFREPLLLGLQRGLEEMVIYETPSISLLYPGGLIITFPENAAITSDQAAGVRRTTAEDLRMADVVAEAYSYDQFASGEALDGPFVELFRNSFHPDRAADVVINFKENYVFPASIPANHGSPYRYDTHVPFIVMGPGVPPGRWDRRIHTVDAAPTVAVLLGVDAPTDLDGKVLPEIKP